MCISDSDMRLSKHSISKKNTTVALPILSKIVSENGIMCIGVLRNDSVLVVCTCVAVV